MSSQPETPEAVEPVTETAPANVVGIEQGRERRARDGGPRVKQDRPEKSQRREKRREAKAEDAARHAPDVLSEAEAAEIALAMPDGESGSKTSLSAPVVNTATVSAKSVERLQSTFDGAQQVMFAKQDVTMAVAPLIRHLNAVTDLLNESQRSLGRAQIEREVYRRQLAEALDVPVDELSIDVTDEVATLETGKIETKPRPDAEPGKSPSAIAAFFGKTGLTISEGHTKDDIARTARRRQMLAVVIITGIGIGMFVAQRNGKDVTGFSRDSLAELQYIGIFFNVFLMVWMLYRVARVGGKGAKWLFPDPERKQGRRRR